MATDLERLVVQLSADIKGYENALKRAQGTTNRQTRQIERRFDRMNKGIAAGASRLGGVLAAAFAGAASLRGAQQLVDASTRIENALKVAGLAGEELTRVYDELYASAQRNAAPLESLVTLYGRAAIVQKELGVSTEELLRFTDNVAVALRVAGTDAQSASGALFQLSQALGSGVVRAEEFNSVLEGALPIAQAAAAGIEEAGGSVARLRTLVIEGKISSQAFFRGFEAGAVILEEKVAGAELTVSQSFVRLMNVLTDTAGELNDGTEASRKLSGALEDLGEWVDGLDFDGIINDVFKFATQVGNAVDRLDKLKQAAYDVARGMSEARGSSFIGDALVERGLMVRGDTEGKRQQYAQDRINDAFRADEKGGRVGSPPTEVTVTEPIRQITIADYPITGGGAGDGSGGGRGDSVSDIERQREAVRDLIADLEFERSLIGMTEVEQEQANAVRRAGSAATEEQRAKIEALIGASYREREAIEAKAEAYRNLQQVGETALNGLITAMADGKVEGEELLSVLIQVAQQFLSMQNIGSGGSFLSTILGGGPSFASLSSPSFTPNTTLGSLLTNGFASGTANTGGRRGEIRGAVHGQEAVIPLPNGGRVPVDIRGSGAAPTITYAPTYNVAQGADPVAIAELRKAQQRDRQQFASNVVKAIKNARVHSVNV